MAIVRILLVSRSFRFSLFSRDTLWPMANEITLSVAFDYLNGSVAENLRVDALSVSVLDSFFFHGISKIQNSEGALELGEQDAIGYFVGVNRGSSGVISIRQATGAGNMIELNPGEVAVFKFAAACTAPFAISTVNDTELEYIIVSA